MRSKLIVILGSTASGKTEWAIKLAQKFNGEIISADSRQIYRGMDIGTAKPIDKGGIPHYLIDVVNPDEEWTLAQFQKMAKEKIENIQQQSKIPFLVGGTGLYIQAVVDNLEIPKVAPSQALRKKLEQKSTQELFEDLKRLDLKTAEIIDSKNRRRLIRALEVRIISKASFISAKQIGESLFETLQIGIRISQEKIYKRIDKRVEEQMKQGLESEVRRIYEELSQKLPEEKIWQLPSMSGIYYQEFKGYFEGKIDLAEVIKLSKLHNRQYARKQMTWFKRDKRIQWVTKFEEAEELIKNFLNKTKGPLTMF
jgi:tRNA dimethylallyltransferase